MSRWFPLLALFLLACSKHELRGHSDASPDGKTYLIVAESPGCTGVMVDGKSWRHPLGTRGAVPPGKRRISCSGDSSDIQFEVKPGTTFTFDYWGP